MCLQSKSFGFELWLFLLTTKAVLPLLKAVLSSMAVQSNSYNTYKCLWTNKTRAILSVKSSIVLCRLALQYSKAKKLHHARRNAFYFVCTSAVRLGAFSFFFLDHRV